MKEKRKERMNYTLLNSPKPKCTRNWANLPNELLEKIAQHRHSRIQLFRLRSVCTSWRSAISLSASPSSATICRLENHHNSSAFLVKVIETSSNHFLILNPLAIPNSNFVLNNTLNMLNYRLFELAKGCHLTSNAPSNGSVIVQKAVIFRDCGIVAIYGFGKLGFRVFGKENWTLLGDPKRYYDDLLFYQGEYYVIDRLGSIFWIDKQMNLFQHLPKLNNSMGQLNNLVGSNGHLYVVDSYFDSEYMGYVRTDMKVYTMDEQWGTWVQVKSLKDRIFVLSKDACLSVSVDDFPGCEGNCIYFTDYTYTEEEVEYPGYLRLDHQNMSLIGCSTNGNSGAELGYYAYRVFSFNDRRMRYVECCPTLQRLFSPPKDCSCSALSLP